MTQAVNLIVFPVKDVAQAKKLYTKVTGVEPYADAPYYVGFRVGGQEIGLDPNGHKQGLTGPLPYWEVKDIKKSLQSLQEAGAQVAQGVKDVGGGKLIALVKDADNNMVGLVQSP